MGEQKEANRQMKMRRANRTQPEHDDWEGVVNYFMDTHPEDMEYEISRMRPAISMELLMDIDTRVNTTRLQPEPTQAQLDEMYELEALSQVLKEGTLTFDMLANAALKAQDNLVLLLTSKEKKKAILELAEKNEIDDTLLLLLDENAAAAAEG